MKPDNPYTGNDVLSAKRSAEASKPALDLAAAAAKHRARVAYQRDYMRKRRAALKDAGK